MFYKTYNTMGRPTDINVIHPNYLTLTQRFYEYLIQLGYSKNTCEGRSRIIKVFLHFAETSITTDITAITTKDIIRYYQFLQQRPNKNNGGFLKEKSIIDCMQSIQQLFTMLQHQGQIQINPTSTIELTYQKQESPRTALTQQEIQELYNHCKTYQEKAILALAYGCGLRVGELVQCNIEDLQLREGLIIIPKGKGNKTRTVPMSKTVIKDITNYLYKERLQQQTKDTKAFILHSRLERMQKGTYNEILKKIINRTKNENIKIKQISIHNLRHSIATHLIEQGVPLERVKEFLGHEHLKSTEVYTHISTQQLQKLVE